MSKRYHIKTVEDFFSVPVDKLQPLLNDFATFLMLGHEFEGSRIVKFDKSEFLWVDDGIAGLSEIMVVRPDTESPCPESPE
jgi:hypothetical protein